MLWAHACQSSRTIGHWAPLSTGVPDALLHASHLTDNDFATDTPSGLDFSVPVLNPPAPCWFLFLHVHKGFCQPTRSKPFSNGNIPVESCERGIFCPFLQKQVCVWCGLQAAVPLTQWPKLDIQVHLIHRSRQAPLNHALALPTWVVTLDAGSQGRCTQHLIQTVLFSHWREAEILLLCYFSIFYPLPEWSFHYLRVYLFVPIRMSHLYSKKVAEYNANIPCGMKAWWLSVHPRWSIMESIKKRCLLLVQCQLTSLDTKVHFAFI